MNAEPVGPWMEQMFALHSKITDANKHWMHLWTSTMYGARARFPKEFQQIKDESAKMLTSLEIHRKLRTNLKARDSSSWVEWYKWVQDTNPDAPTTPPL